MSKGLHAAVGKLALCMKLFTKPVGKCVSSTGMIGYEPGRLWVVAGWVFSVPGLWAWIELCLSDSLKRKPAVDKSVCSLWAVCYKRHFEGLDRLSESIVDERRQAYPRRRCMKL
ncbi:hypothetical protein [Pseudomonas sp. LRF_L74]|uniref:hypothetical protein n=1 Tax=Pseudomonas sp. LRF_L74 TaxID=3369422 RepID=UPI003F5FA4B4